jgi:hypothetical protein
MFTLFVVVFGLWALFGLLFVGFAVRLSGLLSAQENS